MNKKINIEEMKRYLKRSLKNRVRITTSLVMLFLMSNGITRADYISIDNGKIYSGSSSNFNKKASQQDVESVGLNARKKGDKNEIARDKVAEGSVAIGFGAETKNENFQGKYAVAIGHNSSALAENSISIGKDSDTSAYGSIAIGKGSKSTNANSVSIGSGAKTSDGAWATAVGAGALSEGELSVAVGTGSKVIADQFGLRESFANYEEFMKNEEIKKKFEEYKKGFEKVGDKYKYNRDTKPGERQLTEKELFATFYKADNYYLSGKETVKLNENTWIDSKHLAASQGVAIGSQAVSTEQATSIGNDTYALGRSSIAIGNDDNVLYTNSISTYDYENYFKKLYDKLSTDKNGYKYGFSGSDAYAHKRIYSPTLAAGHGSIAIGSRSLAYGSGSTAFGTLAFALKYGATAIGSETRAEGIGAIAVGRKTNVFSDNSVSIGNETTVLNEGGMAYGYKANSGGKGSIAIGNEVYSNVDLKYSDNYFKNYENNSKNVNINELKNELSKKDGKVFEVNRELHNGVRDVITNKNGAGSNSIVIGSRSAATGDNSLSLGHGSFSKDNNAFAIGSYSYASKENSLAFGVAARALEQNSLAIGNNATSYMKNSIALGYESKTDYTTEDLEKNGWVPRGILATPSTQRVGVISVGKKGAERRIVNVASGYRDSDAVNVAQLRALEEKLNQNGLLDDLKGSQIDSGVHYLSVNKDGKDDIKNIMQKQKDYQDYVEYKSKYLEALAKQNIRKENSNALTKYIKELKKKVDELEGKENNNSIKNSELKKINESQMNGDDFDSKIEEIYKAKAADKYDTDGETIKNILTEDEKKRIDESNFTNKGAKGKDSIAFGYKAQTGNNGEGAIAIGLNASAQSKNGIAIGQGAIVEENSNDSIAFGNGSRAIKDTNDGYLTNSTHNDGEVVSFGGNNKKRRIVNVADGHNDSDAVTIAQLKALQTELKSKITENKGSIEEVEAEGKDNPITVSSSDTKTGKKFSLSLDKSKAVTKLSNGANILGDNQEPSLVTDVQVKTALESAKEEVIGDNYIDVTSTNGINGKGKKFTVGLNNNTKTKIDEIGKGVISDNDANKDKTVTGETIHTYITTQLGDYAKKNLSNIDDAGKTVIKNLINVSKDTDNTDDENILNITGGNEANGQAKNYKLSVKKSKITEIAKEAAKESVTVSSDENSGIKVTTEEKDNKKNYKLSLDENKIKALAGTTNLDDTYAKKDGSNMTSLNDKDKKAWADGIGTTTISNDNTMANNGSDNHLVTAGAVKNFVNGKGLIFKSDFGQFNKTLGSTIEILGGKSKNNENKEWNYKKDQSSTTDPGIDYTTENVMTKVDNEKIFVGLKKDSKFRSIKINDKSKISQSNSSLDLTYDSAKLSITKDGDKVKLSGLKDNSISDNNYGAAGVAATQKEVKDVLNKINDNGTEQSKLKNGTLGTLVYTDKDGNKLMKDVDGKFYKAKEDGTKEKDAKEVESKDVILSTVKPDGKTTDPITLGNVASALGLSKDNKGNKEILNKLVNKESKDVYKETELNKVVTLRDLQFLASKGITFAGSIGTATKFLGDTITINGSNSTGLTKDNFATKYETKNIAVKVDNKTGNIEVGLAKELSKINSITSEEDANDKTKTKITLSKDGATFGVEKDVVNGKNITTQQVGVKTTIGKDGISITKKDGTTPDISIKAGNNGKGPSVDFATKEEGNGENKKTVGTGSISGLADLTKDSDGHMAANKNYVDEQVKNANNKVTEKVTEVEKKVKQNAEKITTIENSIKTQNDNITNNTANIEKNTKEISDIKTKIEGLKDNKPFEYFEKSKDGVFGSDGKIYPKGTVFDKDGKAYKDVVIGSDNKVYDKDTKEIDGKHFKESDKVTKQADGKYYTENEIKDKTYDKKAKTWLDKDGNPLNSQPTQASEVTALTDTSSKVQKPVTETKLVRGKDNKFYTESDLKDAKYENGKYTKNGSDVLAKNPNDVIIKAMPNSEAMSLGNIGVGRIEKGSTDAINGGQLHEELSKKLNVDGSNIDQKEFAKNASKGADISKPSDILVTDKQVSKHLTTNYYNKTEVNKMITTIDKKADIAIENSNLALGGVANAVAMANLVQVSSNSTHRHNLSAAYGYYGKSHALAIGFSGINKENNFVYKLSGSVNNQGNLALGIGAGVMLGETNDYKERKDTNLMKKELDEANKKIADYEEKQKKSDEKIKSLEQKQKVSDDRMKELEKKLELLLKNRK